MHFQELDVSRLPRNTKETGWLEVTPRADGGYWRLPFLYITGAATGPTLLVLGAVHGDEYEGVETIPLVFQRVTPDALRGTLLMVPICNVPAYEAAIRNSPIDGMNLARVFPGDARGTTTQRIAYFLTEKLMKPADFLIDLHSGGVTGNIPTLIGYIRSDDERGRRALAGALAFGAPVVWGHPLPVPLGRSLTAATDLGIPALYTEAPGGGHACPDDVSCFTIGTLNVMKHLNMLDGEPQPQPMTHHLVGDGNLDTVISAPVAGYFRPEVALLEEVSDGQQLGTVQNPFGEMIAEIMTEQAGVIIMLRRIHRVHAGDSLAHVTGRLA
jgi:predicted deacylase